MAAVTEVVLGPCAMYDIHPKMHLKLKSYLPHYVFRSCLIALKFCTEHDSIYETGVMDEWV